MTIDFLVCAYDIFLATTAHRICTSGYWVYIGFAVFNIDEPVVVMSSMMIIVVHVGMSIFCVLRNAQTRFENL